MTEKINAVIYARYSSHNQQELSIEGQLRDCYAFAEREGYAVVGEYIDRAISARTDERPDFKRMINDAQKKQFQVVLVWKLDRFARNRYDSAHYKSKLKKHGVRVISVTENISEEPEGIILEGLLESLAEFYSANLSKHVKRGHREALLKGYHLGSRPPFGYKIVNKKLEIDENVAPIIRDIFRKYAAGIPKKEIIDSLNMSGIKSYYGKPLTLTSFQSCLRNKKYIGIFKHGDNEMPGGCPAMIDEHTFYAVQKRLDAVKRAPAANKAKVRYLLQGKAYCGHCGARLVGDSGTGNSGAVYNYYACGVKKKTKNCEKKNEKKGFLEWYVVEQTLEYVLSTSRMDYIAEKVVALYDDEFSDANVKSMERRVRTIDGQINRMLDTIMNGAGKSKPRIMEKIEDLETQKEDLEIDLSKMKIANKIRYTKEQVCAWLKLFCDGDPLDINFQQRIMDVFINSVYLYNDKVVIYYNIKDGQQITYIEMIESTEEPPHGGDPCLCNGLDCSDLNAPSWATRIRT